MVRLLQKYTPEEIAEVVDGVMRSHNVVESQRVVAPTSTITERKKRAKKMAPLKSAIKSPRTGTGVAPTRPLNSWMAFRSESFLLQPHLT